MRKEIVAEEFEEEAEYYADDFQHSNDDDEEDNEQTSAADGSNTGSVVIKSDGTSPVNHAKIISEVLKKYPHLVKNNKNIKLKIMQKGNSPVTVAAISKDASASKTTAAKGNTTVVTPPAKVQVAAPLASTSKISQAAKLTTTASAPTAGTSQPKKIDSRTMHALILKGAENMTGPWLCLECGVNGRPISIPSYKGFRRHLINIHKQKIDARLCEHCGWRSTNRADLHYHIFIKHNIQPPQDLQFPKCGLCDFIGLDQAAIRRHKEEEHQQHSSQQQCIYCNKTFTKEILLYSHMRNNHKKLAQEDGVMDFSDDEIYDDETDKYIPNHPGVEQINTSSGSDNKIKVLSNIALPSKSPYVIDATNTAVLLSSSENINLEPSSEAEGLSNVASGIATSLGVLDSGVQIHDSNESYHDESGDLQSSHYIEAAMATVHGETISPKKEDEGAEMETKFITEEGSELQLTAAQKAELLEQLQGQGEGITDGVVMVLNDTGFEHHSGNDLINTSGNQNIVLVYDDQQQQSNDNSASEVQNVTGDAKDSDANQSAEWSEDLQKSEDEQSNAKAAKGSKSEDKNKKSSNNKTEIDKKKGAAKKENTNTLISALEGDWSDDEDDDTTTSEKNTEIAEGDEVLVSTVTETKTEPVKGNKTKIVDDLYDSSSNSSDNAAKKKSVKDEKTNEKKLSNILADWDSQASEKFEDDDDADDEGKETENDDKKNKNGKASKTDDKKEGNDRKNNDKKKENETSQEKKSKTSSVKEDKNDKKTEQKSDLKTLINDWGDDDNEDDEF